MTGVASETHILTPGAEWDRWVRRAPHDFYHLSGYHGFAEEMREGRAQLAVHGTQERFIAWPYLLRDLGGGLADAGSVYGYTGPVGAGLDDAGFRAEAWEALCGLWAGQRVVTMFTRMHPLLGNAGFCGDFHGEALPEGGELMHLGRSVSIDVTLPTDERRARYPQPLRQDVKRAEREGMVVELDPAWQYFDVFTRLYRATMQRAEASDAYRFSDDYFDRLRTALSGVGHLSVALMDGVPTAALMFTVCGAHAAAHLTGIDAAYNRHSPLKVLLDQTCEIARDMGATRLHLGAGRGGFEDSLYDFKSRFSPDRHDFVAGRWILDADACARLTADAGVTAEATFFPAYRMGGAALKAAE